MDNDLIIDNVEEFFRSWPIVWVLLQASLDQLLNYLMSWLKIRIKVQVFWHVQNNLPDVLLNLLGVFLRVVTSERISLSDEVE